MTEKYTPEKVSELVAELEGFAAGSESARATLMRDAADALTAVSTERDRLDESFDRDLPWRYSEVLEQVKTMRADRDRLHKAITEALAGLELSAEPDWPGWNVLTGTENILHAALDKEGNDDGRAGSRPARPVIDREALIHAIAARHWDEDSGDVENWDGLTASERQNVIDNYLCPRVADAVLALFATPGGDS